MPALTHHEKDASPYLTCAVTFARDPQSGGQSM
ncbi:MAG: UbiD family decarboxylase, partial [Betaproteobacteria bacterium]|nr:UbiD family decarboxylase [Betaproteobacteria bacterium]